MHRRLPLLLGLFVVSFGAAAFGTYSWRTTSDDGGGTSVVVSTSAPADTTAVSETTMVLNLESTVAGAETTVAQTAPPATEAPTTSPPTTIAEVQRPSARVTTDGAILGPLGEVDRRLLDPASECASLSRTGTATQCGRTQVAGVDAAWVLEPAGGLDVLIREPGTEDIFNVALRTSSTPVGAPRFVDVTGDGADDLVVGWRDGAGALAVDVVEFRDDDAVVTLHVQGDDGRASAGDGRLEFWNGVPLRGEDASAPSSFDRWTYTKSGGRWTVTSERDDSPPTGEF